MAAAGGAAAPAEGGSRNWAPVCKVRGTTTCHWPCRGRGWELACVRNTIERDRGKTAVLRQASGAYTRAGVLLMCPRRRAAVSADEQRQDASVWGHGGRMLPRGAMAVWLGSCPGGLDFLAVQTHDSCIRDIVCRPVPFTCSHTRTVLWFWYRYSFRYDGCIVAGIVPGARRTVV